MSAITEPLPVMPLTVEQKLLRPGGVTPVPFEQRNDVLQNAALQKEVGYTRLQSGAAQLIYFYGDYEYHFTCNATYEDIKRIAESVP